MAYLMTAILTGGVAAILSLYAGDPSSQIMFNYVVYGHFGMGALAAASVTADRFDRRSDDRR